MVGRLSDWHDARRTRRLPWGHAQHPGTHPTRGLRPPRPDLASPLVAVQAEGVFHAQQMTRPRTSTQKARDMGGQDGIPVTVAQGVIKSLGAASPADIFGIPGGAILPAYDPLMDSPIRHILVRHEQ